MGLTSLQVCMDSSDWLQGTMHHEESSGGMDSSSSPSATDMLCTRQQQPLMENSRRLRPPHDQAIKCPRCESTFTKFCYYNNYSLSQPRYFCKTCRRYWTKGGTLRNIPVGGGCRKNKKASSSSSSSSGSKKPNNLDPLSLNHNHQNYQNTLGQTNLSLNHTNPTDHLHNLLFPDQFSQFGNLLGGQYGNFMESGKLYNIGGAGAIDFMENKMEGINGNSRNHEFNELGMVNLGLEGNMGMNGISQQNNNFQGLCSPFGVLSLEGNNTNHNHNHNNGFMDMSSCQRQMLPYDFHGNDEQRDTIEMKPNPKLLALEWQQQDHACSSDPGKNNNNSTFGYHNSLGSWSGIINGYGSNTTTNPLV